MDEDKMSKIRLTVAMPLYRAKHIAWLALESLCRQEDIDFDWELIIAEETPPEHLPYSYENIKKFINRLHDNGCRRVHYIGLSDWIPLSNKWRLIADYASNTSEVYVIQPADCYSAPNRLSLSLKMVEEADWMHGHYCLTYNTNNDAFVVKEHRPNYHPCGAHFALKTSLMKKMPEGNKAHGVDGYIFRQATKTKGKKLDIVFDTSDSWKKSVTVHGLNSISKNWNGKRYNKVAFNPEETLPKDIVKSLKGLKSLSKDWEIGVKGKLTNAPVSIDHKYSDTTEKYSIITVSFPNENQNAHEPWGMLKKGHIRSLAENTRGANISVIEPEVSIEDKGKAAWSMYANNLKLRLWVEEFKRVKRPSVMIDLDTIILHDLYPIFDNDFDIAITRRPGEFWFNGGVIYAKPTEAAYNILDKWVQEDTRILKHIQETGDISELKKIRSRTKHYGMNQPSFIDVYDELKDIGKIIEIPCSIWNSCNQTWKHFGKETKVVHVKSELRQLVTKHKVSPSIRKKYANIIHAILKYYEEGEANAGKK